METKPTDKQWADLVLRNMGDAIIATDERGAVVLMNQAAEALTGMAQKNAAGLPLRDVFNLAHPDVSVPTPRAFIKNRDPRHFRRSVLIAKSGKRTLVDGTMAPVLDAGGNLTGTVLWCRDVAEAVAEEHASLDRQKILAIGSLARSVSQDFSNWLSAISGHASSIADNLIPNTRAHEEALRILDVAEQASGLAKRLLSVAHATDVKGDGKVEKLSLGEIVKDAITLVESAFLKQKIVFKLRPLDSPFHVLAESGLLLDCLMHVFLNAAEAIPNGGAISIDVSEETDSGKHFVALRVRDTGPGMEKDAMDQIFQPFFTSKKGKGPTHGLGLSTVLNAVHKWGGFIKIRSQAGHGTSLRLFIPRADVPPPKDARGKAADHAGGETILFVDDDAELVATMKTTLKEAGYRVYDAANGEDSVAIYKKHVDRINLSVIDVVMPGKDGKHVLEEILRIDPTAPIVMSSGFSRDYVRGYLERGAWTFIQKPYDPIQLLAVIRRVLDQKTARQKASAG